MICPRCSNHMEKRDNSIGISFWFCGMLNGSRITKENNLDDGYACPEVVPYV